MSPTPSSGPPRLGFAGTPAFAATILAALLEAGHRPLVVYTQPDRPGRRGRRPLPPPVKVLAQAHDLPVRQPETLRGPEPAAEVAALALDVLVVAAYGLILPPAVLAAPRLGCINVHASLLPRWRGAAPVERAIMAGDTETGVSIMRMERGLDTGPVYTTRRCPIGPHTTGPELEAELARLGAAALLDCLARLDELTPVPQREELATYAPKLTRADARLDWHRPAAELERQVRALCGRLPAFTTLGDVQISVLEARVAAASSSGARPGTIVGADASGVRVACAADELVLTRVRLNVGKGRPLDAADLLNGYRELVAPGTVLEAPGAAPSAS
ncbi:MAG TPA: methionyl-tRNA formyltransferase [Pseudomonadales bacterium]